MIDLREHLGSSPGHVLKIGSPSGKTVSLLVPFADMEQAIEMVPADCGGADTGHGH